MFPVATDATIPRLFNEVIGSSAAQSKKVKSEPLELRLLLKLNSHQHRLRTAPGKAGAGCCPLSGLPLAPRDLSAKPRLGSSHVPNAKNTIYSLTGQGRKEGQAPLPWGCPRSLPSLLWAWKRKDRNCAPVGYTTLEYHYLSVLSLPGLF